MPQSLTVSRLAQLCGIPVATLRIWEQRYGWPNPERMANGYRCYSEDVVRDLQEAARRVANGQRPLDFIADGRPIWTLNPVAPRRIPVSEEIFQSVPQPTSAEALRLRERLEEALRHDDEGTLAAIQAEADRLRPSERGPAVYDVLRAIGRPVPDPSARKAVPVFAAIEARIADPEEQADLSGWDEPAPIDPATDSVSDPSADPATDLSVAEGTAMSSDADPIPEPDASAADPGSAVASEPAAAVVTDQDGAQVVPPTHDPVAAQSEPQAETPVSSDQAISPAISPSELPAALRAAIAARRLDLATAAGQIGVPLPSLRRTIDGLSRPNARTIPAYTAWLGGAAISTDRSTPTATAGNPMPATTKRQVSASGLGTREALDLISQALDQQADSDPALEALAADEIAGRLHLAPPEVRKVVEAVLDAMDA